MPENTNLFFKDALRTDMAVTTPQPLRLCVSPCEPICARSEYEIGIEVFGNPVATFSIRGVTRIENCRDGQGPIPTKGETPP